MLNGGKLIKIIVNLTFQVVLVILIVIFIGVNVINVPINSNSHNTHNKIAEEALFIR